MSVRPFQKLARTHIRKPGYMRLGICLLILAAILTGCKRENVKMVEVSGRICYQGKPAELLMVTFCSSGTDRKVRCYHATTDPEGRFSLSCPAGQYKVTLVPMELGVWDEGSALVYQPHASVPQGPPEGSDNPSAAKPPPHYVHRGPPIPEQYRTYHQTPLTITINAEKRQELELNVE